jgi:hypothetical protein
MTRKAKEIENIVRVKLALADKYRRKARSSRSKPRKAVFFRLAERYQRQADSIGGTSL